MIQTTDVAPMHTIITVSDYERAAAFYTGAFGFKMAHERSGEEAFEPILQLHDVKFREGFMVLGGMVLVLLCFERPGSIQAPPPAANRLGLKLIAFGVTDIDAVATRILQHGGQVLEHTRLKSQFGTQLMVSDPDGIQIELVQRT